MTAPNQAVEIARLDERIRHLESWQRMQNSTLSKLDDRVTQLDEKLDSRLGDIQRWLIGLMGGVATAILMLGINIVMGR